MMDKMQKTTDDACTSTQISPQTLYTSGANMCTRISHVPAEKEPEEHASADAEPIVQHPTPKELADDEPALAKPPQDTSRTGKDND